MTGSNVKRRNMDDREQDVMPESSAGEAKEVVNNEVEATLPQAPETPDEAAASTPEVKQDVPKDRPIENVIWEVKRKQDELIPSLQKQIEELTNAVKETKAPAEPVYSRAQLMAYAADPQTTTEQRLWAYSEVDKVEKSERIREREEVVNMTRIKTETELKRSQSANWIATNFPETTIRDANGNVLGWDSNNPLLARANQYMGGSKALREDPEGFVAAVKMAAFDLGIAQGSNAKLNKTVGQLRKEQKKQLVSSSGTRPTENNETQAKTRLAKLKEEYANTGNADVFSEIVKLRKLNPFV